jgi:hypothetical protein
MSYTSLESSNPATSRVVLIGDEGATVASAAEVSLTHPFHVITGTETIDTISGVQPGELIVLKSEDGFTFGESGNIRAYTEATTPDSAFLLFYDGEFFYEFGSQNDYITEAEAAATYAPLGHNHDSSYVRLIADQVISGIKRFAQQLRVYADTDSPPSSGGIGPPAEAQTPSRLLVIEGSSASPRTGASPMVAVIGSNANGSGTYGTGAGLLVDTTSYGNPLETTSFAVYARQGPGSTASMAGYYGRVYLQGAAGPDTAWGPSFEQTSFGGAQDIQKYHKAHITSWEFNYLNESGYDSNRHYHAGGDNLSCGIAIVPTGTSGAAKKNTVGILLAAHGENISGNYRGIDFHKRSMIDGKVVDTITVTNPGAGYTTATVTIADEAGLTGSQATAEAVISGGQITAINVIQSGYLYTTPPIVTITGDGAGAAATAVLFEPVAIEHRAKTPFARIAHGRWIQWSTIPTANVEGRVDGINAIRYNAGDLFLNSEGTIYFLRNEALSGARVRTSHGAFEGAFHHTIQTVTLANGANNNITINDTASIVRIVGPTAAFSITGIQGGVAGREITIVNDTAQPMTLSHLDAASSVGNRIFSHVGADISHTGTARSTAALVYFSAFDGHGGGAGWYTITAGG